MAKKPQPSPRTRDDILAEYQQEIDQLVLVDRTFYANNTTYQDFSNPQKVFNSHLQHKKEMIAARQAIDVKYKNMLKQLEYDLAAQKVNEAYDKKYSNLIKQHVAENAKFSVEDCDKKEFALYDEYKKNDYDLYNELQGKCDEITNKSNDDYNAIKEKYDLLINENNFNSTLIVQRNNEYFNIKYNAFKEIINLILKYHSMFKVIDFFDELNDIINDSYDAIKQFVEDGYNIDIRAIDTSLNSILDAQSKEIAEFKNKFLEDKIAEKNKIIEHLQLKNKIIVDSNDKELVDFTNQKQAYEDTLKKFEEEKQGILVECDKTFDNIRNDLDAAILEENKNYNETLNGIQQKYDLIFANLNEKYANDNLKLSKLTNVSKVSFNKENINLQNQHENKLKKINILSNNKQKNASLKKNNDIKHIDTQIKTVNDKLSSLISAHNNSNKQNDENIKTINSKVNNLNIEIANLKKNINEISKSGISKINVKYNSNISNIEKSKIAIDDNIDSQNDAIDDIYALWTNNKEISKFEKFTEENDEQSQADQAFVNTIGHCSFFSVLFLIIGAIILAVYACHVWMPDLFQTIVFNQLTIFNFFFHIRQALLLFGCAFAIIGIIGLLISTIWAICFKSSHIYPHHIREYSKNKLSILEYKVNVAHDHFERKHSSGNYYKYIHAKNMYNYEKIQNDHQREIASLNAEKQTELDVLYAQTKFLQVPHEDTKLDEKNRRNNFKIELKKIKAEYHQEVIAIKNNYANRLKTYSKMIDNTENEFEKNQLLEEYALIKKAHHLNDKLDLSNAKRNFMNKYTQLCIKYQYEDDSVPAVQLGILRHDKMIDEFKTISNETSTTIALFKSRLLDYEKNIRLADTIDERHTHETKYHFNVLLFVLFLVLFAGVFVIFWVIFVRDSTFFNHAIVGWFSSFHLSMVIMGFLAIVTLIFLFAALYHRYHALNVREPDINLYQLQEEKIALLKKLLTFSSNKYKELVAYATHINSLEHQNVYDAYSQAVKELESQISTSDKNNQMIHQQLYDLHKAELAAEKDHYNETLKHVHEVYVDESKKLKDYYEQVIAEQRLDYEEYIDNMKEAAYQQVNAHLENYHNTHNTHHNGVVQDQVEDIKNQHGLMLDIERSKYNKMLTEQMLKNQELQTIHSKLHDDEKRRNDELESHLSNLQEHASRVILKYTRGYGANKANAEFLDAIGVKHPDVADIPDYPEGMDPNLGGIFGNDFVNGLQHNIYDPNIDEPKPVVPPPAPVETQPEPMPMPEEQPIIPMETDVQATVPAPINENPLVEELEEDPNFPQELTEAEQAAEESKHVIPNELKDDEQFPQELAQAEDASYESYVPTELSRDGFVKDLEANMYNKDLDEANGNELTSAIQSDTNFVTELDKVEEDVVNDSIPEDLRRLGFIHDLEANMYSKDLDEPKPQQEVPTPTTTSPANNEQPSIEEVDMYKVHSSVLDKNAINDQNADIVDASQSSTLAEPTTANLEEMMGGKHVVVLKNYDPMTGKFISLSSRNKPNENVEKFEGKQLLNPIIRPDLNPHTGSTKIIKPISDAKKTKRIEILNQRNK